MAAEQPNEEHLIAKILDTRGTAAGAVLMSKQAPGDGLLLRCTVPDCQWREVRYFETSAHAVAFAHAEEHQSAS